MKVLIIGQGGREHALVHALAQSSSVSEVHCIPGNPGIAKQALCHAIDWRNTDDIVHFCLRTEITYVIIGPEEPLVHGLADQLRERGLLVFGPSREGAMLEGSKIYSKNFMLTAQVPTAPSFSVSSVTEALETSDQLTPPYVLKADGLAGGKGVVICQNHQELSEHAQAFFNKKIFGHAGERAVLEQFLPGYELSYLVLTNGVDFQAMPLAQDHKKLMDLDQGPNTGGMGVIAPVEISHDLHQKIADYIVKPTLQQLDKKGVLYRGVLYFGVMVVKDSPYLLEYNCRFGDPETQALLPLLDGDWGQVFYQISKGIVPPLKWKKISSCCVVMAAPGYPMDVQKGAEIKGDLFASSTSSYFLHAGTHLDNEGKWTVNGGRTLCSMGLGTSLKEAIQSAYEQTSHARWNGLQYRKDIGRQAMTDKKI